MRQPVKKILLLNLTRLGDIVQSTPLLRALKKKHPGAELCYLAVNGFAEICGHIPEIDRLIPFDFNTAVAVSRDAIKHLPRRMTELHVFLESLRSEHFDMVINLSHSRHSALLTHLVGAVNSRGLTLNQEGYRQIFHPWARYFFVANLNRHYNRINLVDINQGLSLDNGEFVNGDSSLALPFGKWSLSFKIHEKGEQQADSLLESWPGNEAPLIVGIQPGASLDCKRWPLESFITLGKMLRNQLKASLVVFGSEAEKPLAEQVCKPFGDGALNLAGKTDIAALGSVLRRMELLVTNDTGTQHIAAAVNTPVLSLCFGSALSHETGPYGHGHVVMEADLPCYPCSFHVKCNRFRCQEAVSPDAVFNIAKTMLEKHLRIGKRQEDRQLFHDIKIWSTEFDKKGFWYLRPFIARPLSAQDALGLCARVVWQEILTSGVESIGQNDTVEMELLKTLIGNYLPPDLPQFSRKLDESRKALHRLDETAEDAQKWCKILVNEGSRTQPDLDVIKSAAEEIEKVDEEISRIGLRIPAVHHLVLDFTFRKQNLEGNDFVQLTEHTNRNYKRISAIASKFIRLVNQLETCFEPAEVKSSKPSIQLASDEVEDNRIQVAVQ